MNYIHEEMLKLGADGVIFHDIGVSGKDVFKYGFQEYTISNIETQTIFPRSGRSYYKLINGKKILYDYKEQQFTEQIIDSAKDKIIEELDRVLNNLREFTVGELEDEIRYHRFMQLCGYRDGLRFAIDRIMEEENGK